MCLSCVAVKGKWSHDWANECHRGAKPLTTVDALQFVIVNELSSSGEWSLHDNYHVASCVFDVIKRGNLVISEMVRHSLLLQNAFHSFAVVVKKNPLLSKMYEVCPVSVGRLTITEVHVNLKAGLCSVNNFM